MQQARAHSTVQDYLKRAGMFVEREYKGSDDIGYIFRESKEDTVTRPVKAT